MKTKALLLTLTFLSLSYKTWACDVCQKQQPKMLQGIAHGAGPQSEWDYVIVFTMTVIVLLSLFLAVERIVKPGEEIPGHIKTSILTNEDHA